MTVDDYVEQIAPYFLHDRLNVLTPLEPEEYVDILGLIDEAIDAFPDESVFWFWRGWALQFYDATANSLPYHPNFELIEDAYTNVLDTSAEYPTLSVTSGDTEHTIELGLRVAPEAHFMLAYLYWNSVRRRQPIGFGEQETVDSNTDDPQGISLDLARGQWQSFLAHDGLEMPLQGSWFYFHPFTPPVWSELLDEMFADLVDEELKPEILFKWGYAWTDLGYISSGNERDRAFEEARSKYLYGSRVTNDSSEYRLCCQAHLARFQSQEFKGDPRTGLREWGFFAKILAEGIDRGQVKYERWGQEFIPFVMYFMPTETEDFLYENPSLEAESDALNVIEKLRELKWLDPNILESPKLAWYFGKCHLAHRNWKEAEQYLRLAYAQMPLEPELIIHLALALDEQGTTDESVRLLRSLPEQTERGTLLRKLAERDAIHSKLFQRLEHLPAFMERTEKKLDTVYGLISNLGETFTSALKDFHMPDATSVSQSDGDLDEIAERIAERVSDEFRAIIAAQPALFENIRRKCQSDLYRVWKSLPIDVQDQIAIGETMHIVFSEQSIPEFGALVVQWGRVIETLVRDSFVSPFASYLDNTGHRSSILIDRPTKRGKFRTEQLDALVPNETWIEKLNRANYVDIIGILLAGKRSREHHVSWAFLEAKGMPRSAVDIWMSQVPEQLNAIRDYRNDAAHNSRSFLLADALTVRSIVFTEGLLTQMANLFEYTRPNN